MSNGERLIQFTDNAEIPADRELPGLEIMLDSSRVASILRRRIGSGESVRGRCEITYIRYKPGTNCIIAYRYSFPGADGEADLLLYAKVYSAAEYSAAVEKSANHRWIEIPGTDPVIILPEHSTIIYLYPNDCIMDGLRIMADPRKIQRILYEFYDKFSKEEWRVSDRKIRLKVMRYKPERRVVLRCDTRAVNRKTGERVKLAAYLRIYGDDPGPGIYSVQQELYDKTRDSREVGVPRPLGYMAERRALLMEEAPGVQLLASRDGGNDARVVSLTAKALAALHRTDVSGLREKSAGYFYEETAATRDMLKNIIPPQAARADEVFELLGRRVPPPGHAGTVHGDFYYGQVLNDKGRIIILDFDRAHRGDTEYDAGNFIAHLRLLRIRGELPGSGELESIFLKTYRESRMAGLQNLEFWIALGLFRLSVAPFRALEHSWVDKTIEILVECEKVLKGQ